MKMAPVRWCCSRKFKESSRKLSEYSLWGLVFCAGFSLSLLEIFFSLALLFFLLQKTEIFTEPKKILQRQGFLPDTPLNLPLAVFAAAGVLSVIFSIDPGLSLRGAVIRFFKWIIVYFLVVEHVDTSRKLRTLTYIVLCAATLVSVNALWQAWSGTCFLRGFQAYSHRIGGSMGNPNSLAGYLVIMFPIFFSLSFFRKQDFLKTGSDSKNKILGIALKTAAAIIFVALLKTYSRGAWLGVFFGMLFIAFFQNGKFFWLTLGFVALMFFFGPSQISGRMTEIFSKPDERRIELWRQAFKIIRDNFFFGTGLNTYSLAAEAYSTEFTRGFYPHNGFIHLGVETGVFGLGSFLWVIFKLFKTGLSGARKRVEKQSNLVIGLLAGILAFLVHAFFDTNIHSVQLGVLLWFMMGFLVAAKKVSDKKIETL